MIVLAIVLAVVGALAFVLERAPDYFARYLVRNYFQGLNIDTSGVETIDINPLRGEISFGPVTFRGAEGEAGEVGRIGVKVDVSRLLRRQALVEAAVIEGIRIDIHQAANGEIDINGIPLTRILAEQAAQQPSQPENPATPPPGVPPSVAERLPWEAGLDRLELRDSRIVFTREGGGEATIEVQELDLEGFATWAPDDPGHFRLDGRLNQIGIAIAGTATPFATSVGIDAEVAVTGIELAKVEKFSGPLGLSPNAGRADVTVGTKGSIVTTDGRIEAQLQGQAKLTGIDMASHGFGSIRVADGGVNLNGIRVQADAQGRVDIAGDASIELGALALRLDDGTEVGFDSAALRLPALTVVVPVGVAPTFKITPQLEAQALTLGGPDVQGRMTSAAIRLTRFDLDVNGEGAPITLTGTAGVSGLDLTLPDVEPIRITAEAVNAGLDEARFAFPTGSTRIAGGFGIDAKHPLITISEAAKPGAGAAPAIRISAATFVGTLPTLDVDDGAAGTKVKVASPSLNLDQLQLDVPKGPDSHLQLNSGPIQLMSVDVDVVDAESLVVSGHAGLAAPTLSIALGAPGAHGDKTAASLSRLAIDLKEFTYREAGAVSGLGLKGRIRSDAIGARIAGEAGEPPKAIDLAGVELTLHDLAVAEGGPSEKTMRARLDLGLRSAKAVMPGGLTPMTLALRDVRLVDAEADAKAPGSYGFERLAIGGFDVSLTRRAGTAAPPPAAEAPAKPTAEKGPRTWPPEGLPVIRIGALGLIESSSISMIDQTLSPPAIATIHLDTLSLQNLDSTSPGKRADVRLKARLDDAQLAVDGWAQPFKPRPDFDLRARINDLVLPRINPYVAPHIGLDLIQGQLIADAEAKAAAGQLKGELRTTVSGVRFADRPEAGSDRISKSVGVPLSTIVSLLEDSDGTIDITLPVEGDLLSPEFDYSDAIWSGLYRVLRALITSPFKLVSASVALVSGMDSGSGLGETTVAATGPALAPLTFAPGETVIAGASRDGVVGLRQLLKDRPRMHLSLCGVATAQDLEPLLADVAEQDRAAATAHAQAELKDLARQRMTEVRNALTEGSGVDRGRVPVCPEPRVMTADLGAPRVELGF